MTQPSLTSSDIQLIPPCGGELMCCLVDPAEAAELRHHSEKLPSVALTARELCDLELLATGAFSPLDRFMAKADYARVLDEMRLATGHIFPVPVTLSVKREAAIGLDGELALRDERNNLLGVMTIEEVYEWDRAEYARKVLETESVRHPLVPELGRWGDVMISGPLRLFRLPTHYDFQELRLSPSQVRSRLIELGNPDVVAFQTRNALHRAHEEMTKRAIEITGGVLLLHPVVGLTKSGDIEHFARVRTYKQLSEKYYDPRSTLLSLLPLAMRFAGPREAVWHALIRRNYGANHFIVGRDHASPGRDENGKPFYDPYAAQELMKSVSDELGVTPVSFDEFVYLPDTERYEERSRVPAGTTFFSLSGTQFRDDYLNAGRPAPPWLMRPDVVGILNEHVLPRHGQGVCLWFTGLSGAGKSTTAEIVTVLLAEHGRRVTLLDGDIVRTNLSAGLGFDRAGRDANIRRIGFVASEIVRHGGVAVCAAISPYRETRNEVRKLVGAENFIEIFVDTPLEVCEERDPKGMYAKARRGEIADFTGVDDVYEPPVAAELTLNTVDRTAADNAHSILEYVRERGFLRTAIGDENE